MEVKLLNANDKERARQAKNAYMRVYRARRSEEQKEKNREYYRKWCKDNPDKVKASKERYWLRKADKMGIEIMSKKETGLEVIKSKVEAKLTEMNEVKSKLEGSLKSLQDEQDIHVEKMIGYADSFDAKKEMEERSTVKKLQAQIDAIKERLERMDCEPFVSETEYKDMVATVNESLGVVAYRVESEVIELFEKADKITDKLDRAIDVSKDLLKKLQSDLYKDADRQKYKNGVMSSPQEIAKSVYDVVWLGRSGVNSSAYTASNKRRGCL